MPKLSVVIAVKNEERNIRACLEAVKWADEIVIVDDCSVDKTVEICREYTGKIIVNNAGGSFHKNKNLGLEKAAGDWILSLDADEVVGGELKNEITARLASDPGGVDGFYIPRDNYFLGKRITGCGWSPDYIVRLFRKGAAKWPLDIHDVPRLADESRAARLVNPLIHYSYHSLASYFGKFNRYTTKLAGEEREKGVRVGAENFLIFFFIKPLFWSLRKYLFQKGFMDGFRGLFISLSSGLVIFVTYAKLWETQENGRLMAIGPDTAPTHVMKKRSVLYLSGFGSMVGGGEVSLLGLLSGLDSSRFVPVVVCPSEGDLAEEIKKLGIEVSIVPMPRLKWGNPFAFIRAVSGLAELIRDRGIALVHANGSRCAVYGGIAARLSGVPMIWHVRILESDGLLDRFLAGMSVMIMVNSAAVKNRFNWLQDKVQVVYNGIDLEAFKNPAGGRGIRGELGLVDKTALIGTVGRLDWYKAHKYFLEAAGKIKLVVPDSHFLVVGGGEDRAALQLRAEKLGIASCVTFTGHRRDIPAILSALDIFALSSVSEGFGRVAVEAMACGKPVVATRVGGIPEVVEDGVTGKLVPPANPMALAGAVVELLRDKSKAAAMGAAGRRRVEALFGAEKNVKAIETLYGKVLDAELK